MVENEKTETEWQVWIADQMRIREEVFTNAPGDMIAAYNREIGYTRDYHGRELLEMLQNANDAGEGCGSQSRATIVLTTEGLCIGNTGKPFTEGGIESLMVSDNSPKRLSGARYIGNRGLGFRSILNWTNCPFVLSGDLRLGFAREWAKDWLDRLCTKSTKLRACVEVERQCGGEQWPVPTLVVPTSLSNGDLLTGKSLTTPAYMHTWQAALALRDEGYTTIIGIPFTKVGAFEEVLGQLTNIDREALLFATYLRGLTVRLPDRENSWRKAVYDDTIEIEANDKSKQMWQIFEDTGIIPAEHLRDEQKNAPEYQIKLAVPTEGTGPGILYNYFRTKVRFPFSIYAHATLELTNNRDHIADSRANKFLVQRVAEVMATAAEQNHDSREPWRPLSLIAPNGDLDTMLEEWDFTSLLASAARLRKLVPVLAGELRSGTEARRLRSEGEEWLPASEFADVALWPRDTHLRRFLDRLGLPIITEDELHHRLELAATTLQSLEQRAALIAGLIQTKLLPTKPAAPALLLDDECRPILAGRTAFLPPADGGRFELPSWLEVQVLHGELTTMLRERLPGTTLRGLADQLTAFHLQEYALAPVALAIMRGAEKRVAVDAREEDSIRCEALKALYSVYQHGAKSSSTPSRPMELAMPIPTRTGTWAAANSLYLSSEYPGGELVEALYGSFAPESIVAISTALGLADTTTNIGQFLEWLGVSAEPHVKIEPLRAAQAFALWVFDRLKKPLEFDELSTRALSELSNYHFASVQTIDRLDVVLQKAEPHAILAWLATDRRIEDWRTQGDHEASFRGQHPGKQKYRRLIGQVVPSHVLWQLSTIAWVPVLGGGKRPPGQCVLVSSLPDETRQSLPYPVLSPDHALLKQCGIDPIGFSQALERVGISRSLDDLTWDQFYTMLLELPERDTAGKRAGALYRALINRTEDGPPPAGLVI